MRKFLMFATIFACIFTFAACNDEDDEKKVELQETTRYRLEAWQGEGLPDVPATIEGILIFGKEKDVSFDSYFSSEANLEIGPFDGVVQSPWREVKGIGYIEVLFYLKGKYYIVSHYVQKNVDNYIYLNQYNEITKQTYEECKRHYEEHVR